MYSVLLHLYFVLYYVTSVYVNCFFHNTNLDFDLAINGHYSTRAKGADFRSDEVSNSERGGWEAGRVEGGFTTPWDKVQQ